MKHTTAEEKGAFFPPYFEYFSKCVSGVYVFIAGYFEPIGSIVAFRCRWEIEKKYVEVVHISGKSWHISTHISTERGEKSILLAREED